MELIHTLLFFIRQNRANEDLETAAACLASLEKSSHKTLVVYNQGFLDNHRLKEFFSNFDLEAHIIGDGNNAGTSNARQSCFEYIYTRFPNTKFISEIHLDMIFAPNWEDPLTDYLNTHDEPIISCGIVDSSGNMPFLNKSVALPETKEIAGEFLQNLRQDVILHGFTNPCVHSAEVLRYTGGYDTRFLRGMQCFEDDSMLLGYYYYYGTRRSWFPKVNYNSVVYHAVAGQRMDLHNQNIMVNFEGLKRQYGAMGLKHLSQLHKSPWHKRYFSGQFDIMAQNNAAK